MSLCTKCHQPVRPVVGLDIDGTGGIYHEHLLGFAEGWLGRSVRREYDGTVDLAEWMAVTKDVYRQIKLAYRQGGMKRVMPMYNGYDDLVWALRAVGVEIWFTTTRPYNRFDSTDPDTREWLRRHVGNYGEHYSGLIYDDDKYERLLEVVGERRIIGIVDDLPEQVEAAEKLGLPSFLISRIHNQHYRGGADRRRVNTLAVAGAALVERARGWIDATK